MCNVCNGFEWIIGLDGKLKRCPTCSTPRQIDWIEREAQLHALRLGMVEEAHDTSNDYEHENGVADGDVESEAAVAAVGVGTGGTGGTGAEWALQLAA